MAVCQDKKKRERQKKKEYRLFDDQLCDIHHPDEVNGPRQWANPKLSEALGPSF